MPVVLPNPADDDDRGDRPGGDRAVPDAGQGWGRPGAHAASVPRQPDLAEHRAGGHPPAGGLCYAAGSSDGFRRSASKGGRS